MNEKFQFEKHKADFYGLVRDGTAVEISSKHIRQFDKEFLAFTQANQSMEVLDIGCGPGLFLRYLLHRGFSFVTGIDYDENLRDALVDVKEAGYTIELTDAETYVDRNLGSLFFDRIVLFDILEHIDLNDCVSLLRKLHGMLSEGGKILIRVPNTTSPWGLRLQFDSFDHITLFTPGRLHELATLTDYKVSAIAGQTTGKRRKVFFQRCLHWTLSRLLPYHPEIWEAALICTFEKAE
jgi:cyclopropane fatty-acyl-phospholipid synthase-like methyltransferase